jgi:hypothetical protein
MLTTYYKTPDPEQRAAAEYYQLYIRAENPDGDLVYFLDENHGWFDADGDKVVLLTSEKQFPKHSYRSK